MPGKRSIEITVEPNEIVVGDPHLEVRAEAPLDPEVVRGAIALESASGRVSLSQDRRVASFVPENGLSPGPQTLVVEELVSTRGKRLSERVEVPFFISDSRAKVDRKLRVESIVRLRIERLGTVRLSAARRPGGKFIEIMKAVDRESGTPVELAFDQDGKRVDKTAIFEQIVENRRSAFGKLHPALKEAVAGAGEGDRIPVAVWFRVAEEPLHEKRAKGGQTARPPRSEVAYAKRIKESGTRVAKIVREHGAVDEPRPDPDAPVVFAELPVDGIRKLQKREEVAALFLYEEKGEVDLSNSMAIAQSDTVHSSLSITGTRRQRRRLRGRAGRDDRPLDNGDVPHQPEHGRPRAAHARDHQEHRSEQAARARDGLQPPLGQQHGSRCDQLGCPHARMHRNQPELPPRRRADEFGLVLRRHVQGLARAPLAVPHDRRGGRQWLEHRVRQSQGLQQADRGQPRRLGGRAGERLRVPEPYVGAQRP